jgi:hypothetical protein
MTDTRNHNGGVSLRDHFERCLDDAERLQKEKWLGHGEAHDLIALALKTQAVASEERLKSMNEWRGTVGDLTSKYVTHDQLDSEKRAIRSDIRQNITIAIGLTAVFSGLVALMFRALGL